MDRKDKIKNLQIKNGRKLLCEKMRTRVEKMDLDNFISLDSTIELQRKVIACMEDMDSKEMCVKKSLDNSYVELVKENLDIFTNYLHQNIVFFHRQFMEVGAIEMNLNLVVENIDYILSMADMYEFGCSVFLVNRDMKFGLCLWKGEYDIKLYKWENNDKLDNVK